ncbi:MAG: hypothetical protein CMJ37_02400 [Phycisphaerae bacterium]|nr:hypothetical protein [Phycisphaerae bacterium]
MNTRDLNLSIGGLVVGLLTFLVLARSPINALLSAPAVGDENALAKLEALRDAHEDARTTWENRFAGRSAFHTPPQPRRPRPVTPPRPVAPATTRPEPVRPPEPVTPPEPTSYTGPKPIAFDGDNLWFSSDDRIRIGGEASRGVTLVGVEDAPYSFRVEYRGKVWDVPLRPRGEDSDLFKPARDSGRGDLEALSIPDEPDPPVVDIDEEEPTSSSPPKPEIPDE